jgi:hypothetical protein
VGTFASTVIGKVSPSVSFVVSNAADVAAGSTTALTLSIQGSDAGDFQLPTNGCGATLASKSSCTATIVFIPLDLGMRTATLMVTATPGGSFSVPLAGVGQGP